MILVGLTGGLASGKTTIAGLFQECGAFLIQADQLARTVVAPGRIAWKEIVKTFGPHVLQADRTLDRGVLAELVFQNPRKLSLLNRIVHPRVAREQVRQTNVIARQRPNAVIIYDAALLIEARAHERMDRIIVVTASQTIQIQRARQRDGLTKKEALARIRGQLPLRTKRRFADYILDGTLPIARLRPTVQQLYRKFLEEAAMP
ncbi:MAG: dephospho-CoA kinase [Nitrospira sp. SB0677_bin_15]|nr:dephospho-CoA kinase [Nitrospira sp. SB0667_bin_9]MYD30214.1 dephospho-CoA kinase [Nitrospira sp. SB0661_bin_20]MYG40952.1 dephospho-CoA kinase [Nitrospira sp. SB0677_bin_15]MYH02140.1 dephospho-CoA kinase [Nitrospira sp. SB0675_bin_23]MYJ22454.1 dephospho-CoA kinase [Nitrospira sp. SB0673_bin_12]